MALEGAFPLPVWVAAEIADLRVNSSSGHCYLELVEKGVGAVPSASARAVVWRAQWSSVNGVFREQTGAGLSAGMKVLLRATVGYHALYGFSLTVSDIDPSYTLGERERQRQQTIARLKKEGVWDINREAGFPAVVQRVAVVSAAGAAGWRDFLQELGRYPYRFELTFFEAVMQGLAAEGSVVGALERVAERMEEFDAVVILRGGGGVSDLAAFDGYRLASHVAQFPLPIVTGIGHDKDRSVVDMVAALELKTPTAAAVWLGESLSAFDAALDGLAAAVAEGSRTVLSAEKIRLERLARVLSVGATEMTRRLDIRLERLRGEVERLSGRFLLGENHRLTALQARLMERAGRLLASAGERLLVFESSVGARRPENILRLGFAIVRLDGRAVRDATELAQGQAIDITLAHGNATAVIDKTVQEVANFRD